MHRFALAALLALALVPVAASQTATIPPPAQSGPWRQLGRTATSRPGALLYFFRQLPSPHALAVVAASSSARPMRVTWWSYCEFQSDDAMTQEDSGALTGIGLITKYLSVMPDSTLCQVQVTARIPGKPKVRVAAAVFGY